MVGSSSPPYIKWTVANSPTQQEIKKLKAYRKQSLQVQNPEKTPKLTTREHIECTAFRAGVRLRGGTGFRGRPGCDWRSGRDDGHRSAVVGLHGDGREGLLLLGGLHGVLEDAVGPLRLHLAAVLVTGTQERTVNTFSLDII